MRFMDRRKGFALMPATKAAQEHLDTLIETIRKGRQGELDFVSVISFAELALESLQSFLSSFDRTVLNEIRGIGEYIAKAKDEICHLQANDLQQRRIPSAGRELDEIVKSTEDATHTIMEAAEEIMSANAETLEDYQAQVNDAVMKIFEACSFQDITGQRISKVVETLQYIETRITRFSEALGIADGVEELTEEEARREQRKAELLLNGPALEGEGTDQDGVDALLGLNDEPAASGGDNLEGNAPAKPKAKAAPAKQVEKAPAKTPKDKPNAAATPKPDASKKNTKPADNAPGKPADKAAKDASGDIADAAATPAGDGGGSQSQADIDALFD